MPLPNDQFLIRLSEITDPEFLCDLLEITSEDILERFEDRVEDYIDYLRESFDIDTEAEGDYDDD